MFALLAIRLVHFQSMHWSYRTNALDTSTNKRGNQCRFQNDTYSIETTRLTSTAAIHLHWKRGKLISRLLDIIHLQFSSSWRHPFAINSVKKKKRERKWNWPSISAFSLTYSIDSTYVYIERKVELWYINPMLMDKRKHLFFSIELFD